MDVRGHYENMWNRSFTKVSTGQNSTDHWIDSPDDNRFGLMLVTRPSEEVKHNISVFLNEISRVDSTQYLYPVRDLHFTVMSIISCYPGFRLDEVSVDEYSAVVRASLSDCDPFVIRCSGLTLFDGGVVMQGFPEGHALQEIRNGLRSRFGTSSLRNSIDSRYRIETCHSTLLRFRSVISDPVAFTKIVERYRYQPWGDTLVTEVEFVYSDWYQRSGRTIHLEHFHLKS